MFLKVYLFWETQEHVAGGRRRERGRISSRLHTVSVEAGAGLELMNCEIMTCAEVQGQMLNRLQPTEPPRSPWIDIFPKKTSRWLTDTWGDAWHHSSSGKYKSKSQWDTTSHLSEWLKLITQEIAGVGEGVEKKKLSCAVSGTANWCSLCGKQYGGSSKSEK